MKLIVRALNQQDLQLELDNPAAPVVKQFALNDRQVDLLWQCAGSYQAIANQSDNQNLLRDIGQQLFQLLNQHVDVMAQWLNVAGSRRLEIHTTPEPNALQRLLLHLPWEVMVYNAQFLAADSVLYEVVRRVGEANPAAPQARYKDLTLVFMAADPGFSSGLDYESEERAILKATRKAKNLNLWVDESGNLDSLTQRIADSVHCDMVHISCHGGYDQQRGFVLQLEDDHYGMQQVTAHEFQNLAQHIQCLFLSACHSAEVADTPSFAMQLAKMGIANVIGWDGSVADEDASAFAAAVYHALLQRATVPYACAIARQHLLRQHQQRNKHPHWHLGRVYLAPDGGWPLLDSSKPASPKRRGKSCHDLLDRKKKQVPVASKETFVGRRAQTKQALQVLAENRAAGVLLTGIGGVGKSSLAARITHRLEPQYKAAVIYQDYSEAAILGELRQFVATESRRQDFQRYLADIQENPDFFADNLLEILEEHLSEDPVIVIVDDVEQHALDALVEADKVDGKVGVKLQYQNALLGLIDAFTRADTRSCLLFTARYNFRLLGSDGQDRAVALQEIEVPDMSETEQEKHWLALLQTGMVVGERDDERDRGFLTQIWAICQGNPGLQDVLYQPLLKGEYAVLQMALDKLRAYHAGQNSAGVVTKIEEVDKYLQRIALEVYHAALSDTERQCLRVLSLFDFAVPEELMIQAGSKLGIADAQTAMQRLDNFGLLTHWRGEGLEGHVSCYGLARKIVAPLSKEDRHFIAQVCVPLLWHIWFMALLKNTLGDFDEVRLVAHYYPLLPDQAVQELMKLEFRALQAKYPLKPQEHHNLPLQQHEFQRISQLHRLCIENSVHDWSALNISPEDFTDLLELSLSFTFFEKLMISYAVLNQLAESQILELIQILEKERFQFKTITLDDSTSMILLILDCFSGTHLLSRVYQLYFENTQQEQLQLIENIEISNKEESFHASIKLAQNNKQRADAYALYANFLANQKQDYTQAEVMYQRALEAEPNHANTLGNYAYFLANQKQDYAQAEVMFQRALEADPNHANTLGNYAYFLANQKQDYAQAEVMFQRALEADPNHAINLGNYALFLKNQKQDYAQAEVMYQRALEADPNDAINLGNYALFLKNQKQDYAQAEVMYQRALEADPNHANTLGNYANFLANQKQDYAQAEVMYQRALEADPNHANTLGNYANFLADQKQDYAQAEVMYQRALEANPNDADNLGNYALFLKNQKQDYAQAEVMYQRALEADPNHANHLGNYAYFLEYQKQDYAQAEVMYQRALEADPNHAIHLGNYANFLVTQKQDYAQAEVMYQRALEADPNHATTLGNYALFLVTQKQDYAQAEVMYQRALEADPNHATTLGNYALFLATQKQDYTQAEVMFQRALEADPNHATNLGNFAAFLHQNNLDHKKAEELYLQALSIEPEHAENNKNYANFLATCKNDIPAAEERLKIVIEKKPQIIEDAAKKFQMLGKEAQQKALQQLQEIPLEYLEIVYTQAINHHPNNPDFLGEYASFLANQKQDYAQAEVMYQRALEADPNHVDILGLYAIFLADQKQDYAQAEVMYQRALEADPNDADNLGNYAKLLFSTNQKVQAQQYLEKAEHQPDLRSDLQLELAFYRYAHCPPHELTPLKQQLQAGTRSIDWDLTANVERATADQHPQPQLLAAIAHVISGEQNLETLEQYPEWNQTL